MRVCVCVGVWECMGVRLAIEKKLWRSSRTRDFYMCIYIEAAR